MDLLLFGVDNAVLDSQAAVFRKAGYGVRLATSETDLHRHVADDRFSIAVFNHTVKPEQRRKLSAIVKRKDDQKLVLILHASGARENPHADAAVDSRKGPDAMIQAVNQLAMMKSVRVHDHEELQGEYVVVVDAGRHYTFVTDGVCALLGFERAELIGRQIEDVSHGKSEADVQEQFREFVADGEMRGEFTLRHRSGKPIPIRYSARVQPDGCLMAVWEPLSTA